METYKEKLNELSYKEKEEISKYKQWKINEYELADLLGLEHAEIGAFIMSNSLQRFRT
jgi:hypothetical protein